MSIKHAAAAVLLSAMTLAPAIAADQKIAIVNVQAIVQQLPQMQASAEAIKLEFAPDLEKVKKLEADITYNLDKQKREALTMSEAQKVALADELGKQRNEYQALAQELDARLRQRQTEERNKIMALVKQSVDSIAADEGYDIVLSSQALVFATPDVDISTKVLEQVSKLN